MSAQLIQAILHAHAAILRLPAHELLGLPDPLEVAQLPIFDQEVIRTKVAMARSLSQFNTSVLQAYEAEAKQARALMDFRLTAMRMPRV